MGGPPLPGWLRIAMLHIIIELLRFSGRCFTMTLFPIISIGFYSIYHTKKICQVFF